MPAPLTPQPTRSPTGANFHRAPFIVIWEVTRACDLLCRHCRAVAQPLPHSRQLTTEEGLRLIDEIAGLGTRLLVFTGGDCAKREDLPILIRRGVEDGLQVSLSPSATPLVTDEVLARWKEAGAARIALSLDGADAATHDAFRGVPGTFEMTLQVVEGVTKAGFTLQIGTTVSRFNLQQLPEIATRVAEMGAVLWNLFFLVPTGRARASDMITPEEHEAVFHWLATIREEAPFDIKTTEGHHFRRVLAQRAQGQRYPFSLPLPAWPDSRGAGAPTRRPVGPSAAWQDGIGRAEAPVNSGRGYCFISHTGKVYPGGFLPYAAGNVRKTRLAEIYRESPVFQALRDPDRLQGKCGVCEYRRLCGGSRARAYALTRNFLASDPACLYQPGAGSGALSHRV